MKDLIQIFIYSVVIAILFVILMGGLQMVRSTHTPPPVASSATEGVNPTKTMTPEHPAP